MNLIEHGKCKRAGLLATQGIRGGANREVLKRIKKTGDIFFAIGDRKWMLDGAVVHVSMVGFDSAADKHKSLDGKTVSSIEINLSEHGALPYAQPLQANSQTCFLGIMKGGAFDIDEPVAVRMLLSPNPHGIPNSDVLRPRFTARDILQRTGGGWIVDFGCDTELETAAKFQAPFREIEIHVKPERIRNRRKSHVDYWWIHGEPRPGLRRSLAGLHRYIVTPEVSKHRIFVWMDAVNLADHQTRAFARSDDYFMGVLQSRFHEVWALAQGTQLREKESGFRYTPTTCFETFPFPFPDDLQPPVAPSPLPTSKPRQPQPDRTYAENLAAKNYFMGKEEPPPYGGPHQTPDDHHAAIAAAATELNELRENWLNPPEWTVETILEFPGSANGPWARYVVKPDKNGIGTVRYPRLGPRHAACAAELKKRTLTNLYNERPAWLDLAHKKLDAAVAAAYGFPGDLTDEQVLQRLLALNLARADEEARAATVKKPKAQRVKQEDELV